MGLVAWPGVQKEPVFYFNIGVYYFCSVALQGIKLVFMIGQIAGGNVQEGELEDAGSLDFQHFFTTMTKDVRIVLVKLADRLHNMRTLESMAPHKQKKKAKETLKYFAPLALMLGLEAATNELEELSLKFIEPDKYRELKRELQQVNQEMEASMKGPRDSLMNHLQACDYLSSQVKGIDIKVQRMPLYKLYEKLLDTGWDLSRNTLLKHDFRLKIELDEKEGSPGPMICYHVLGLVHELWTPIPQTMKDLIHSPVADREKGLITMVWPTAVSGTRLVMPLAVRICTTEMAQSRCMMPPVLHGASNGGKNSVHETSGSLPHKQMNGKSNVDQPLGKEIERKLANHNTLEFNFRLHLWTDGFLRFLKRGNNFNGSDKANGTSSQVEKETMKLSSHGTGFIQAEEWLESVKKFQMGIEGKVTAREFVECMRDDFLVQSVYVLTPMGEVVQLPVVSIQNAVCFIEADTKINIVVWQHPSVSGSDPFTCVSDFPSEDKKGTFPTCFSSANINAQFQVLFLDSCALCLCHGVPHEIICIIWTYCT